MIRGDRQRGSPTLETQLARCIVGEVTTRFSSVHAKHSLTLGRVELFQLLIFHSPLKVQIRGCIPMGRAHGRGLAMRLRGGRFGVKESMRLEISGPVQMKRVVLRERLQAV